MHILMMTALLILEAPTVLFDQFCYLADFQKFVSALHRRFGDRYIGVHPLYSGDSGPEFYRMAVGFENDLQACDD